MRVLCWNIRGCNENSKIKEIKDICSRQKINILALLETRIKPQKMKLGMERMGYNWTWIQNYDYSPKGRIWVGWNKNLVSVTLHSKSQQIITVEVIDLQNKDKVIISFVYGLHTIGDRRALWAKMLSLNITQRPWLVLGDFNTPFEFDHRVNGNQVTSVELQDGRACIQSLRLITLRSVGQKYSWTKRGEDELRIMSCIDHCFGNLQWWNKYGQVCVQYMLPGSSDNCPLMLATGEEVIRKGGRPFKFFNMMANHPEFLKIIEQEWAILPAKGSFYNIIQKLRNIRGKLKTLHTKEFCNVGEKIQYWKGEMSRIQQELVDDVNNRQLQQMERQAIEQFTH